MKQKEEEKYCGNCCWFYGEMTDGEGFCVEAIDSSWNNAVRCDQKCRFARGGCNDPCFVSKDERHRHMDVLRRAMQWYEALDGEEWKLSLPMPELPKGKEMREAISFAYLYIKEFSEL